MGALVTALLLTGDFWPKVAQTPYDTLLAEGARLRTQAERSCLPPISCREGSPAFLAQQALLRQAAAAFQHAAALRPEHPEAPFFAAETLYEAHEYEAAGAAYEEVRLRRPNGPRENEIAFALGTVWARLGRFQRSLDEYTRALRVENELVNRTRLHVNSAESMMALGRLHDSIDFYRRAIEMGERAMRLSTLVADEQSVHLLGLAVALDRDEQIEKSQKTVALALALDSSAQRLHGLQNFFVPEGEVAYYDALVALARGDRAEAASAFTRYLRDVPQSPYVARARAHLAELGAQAPPARNPNRIAHAGVVAAKGPRTALEIDSAMKHFLEGPCVPEKPGTYSLEGTISKQGTVTHLHLDPSDERAISCLRDAARGWRFRNGETGRTTFTLRMVVRP